MHYDDGPCTAMHDVLTLLLLLLLLLLAVHSPSAAVHSPCIVHQDCTDYALRTLHGRKDPPVVAT